MDAAQFETRHRALYRALPTQALVDRAVAAVGLVEVARRCSAEPVDVQAWSAWFPSPTDPARRYTFIRPAPVHVAALETVCMTQDLFDILVVETDGEEARLLDEWSKDPAAWRPGTYDVLAGGLLSGMPALHALGMLLRKVW